MRAWPGALSGHAALVVRAALAGHTALVVRTALAGHTALEHIQVHVRGELAVDRLQSLDVELDEWPWWDAQP